MELMSLVSPTCRAGHGRILMAECVYIASNRAFPTMDNAFFAGDGIGRRDRYLLEARRQLLAGGTSSSRLLSKLLDQTMIYPALLFIRWS